MPAKNKGTLRSEFKARRHAMTEEEVGRASDLIRVRVNNLEQVIKAESVFCFVSIGNEPDTRNLIHDLLDMAKHVSVPRLNADGTMTAHRIRSLDDLEPSDEKYFHIPVPPADAPVEDKPDVVIVPGLAFTKKGQRLGMGGGHYDRYLAGHLEAVTVGLCYDWQLTDKLPSEKHDQPVHLLVTEEDVVTCRG